MKLLFAGDVMLGRLVNRALSRRVPEFPWGDTLPLFKEADARFCNLECVISDKGSPWSATQKVFHFRTDKKNVECLKVAGINAVALANNHTLDYEYEAAFDMCDTLDSEGIAHAGFGRDLNEASLPAFLGVKGMKIGFVSFTDNEPSWEATDKEPGVFYVPVDIKDSRARRLFDTVKEAKKKADLVIVSAHWGPNWGYRPVKEHITFGHRLIDAGVDIMFGHSCHVFHGMEVYRGRPIIYSAGDFVDDYAVDEIERNDESFIFFVEAEAGKINGLSLYPTVITDFHAERASSARAEVIASKMIGLSGEFGTDFTWDEEEMRLTAEIKA